MRTVVLLLVLANVAFFAWSRHVGSPAPGGGADVRKHEPERLPIVRPPERTAAPPKSAAAGCLEWGAFSLAERARAEKALEPLALGERLEQRRSEELAGWWVYIPPQGSRQAALRKAAELKALGVQDYFIIGDEGDERWALSLGIFRTVEAAQSRLAGLQARGVRSAAMGARDTVVPKIWLQVKSADPALQARLAGIAKQIEGSELRPCPER